MGIQSAERERSRYQMVSGRNQPRSLKQSLSLRAVYCWLFFERNGPQGPYSRRPSSKELPQHSALTIGYLHDPKDKPTLKAYTTFSRTRRAECWIKFKYEGQDYLGSEYREKDNQGRLEGPGQGKEKQQDTYKERHPLVEKPKEQVDWKTSQGDSEAGSDHQCEMLPTDPVDEERPLLGLVADRWLKTGQEQSQQCKDENIYICYE